MEIVSEEVVSVSDLVRHFGSYLDQLKTSRLSKLLLTRQSGLEAVLLPIKEYESLLDNKDQLDHYLLYQELKERGKEERGKRITRKELKRKYGLER